MEKIIDQFFLCDPKFVFFDKIFKTNRGNNDFVSVIVSYYDTHNQLEDLLYFYSEQELKADNNKNILFRESSIATDLFNGVLIYTDLINPFLQKTITPLLRQLNKKKLDIENHGERLIVTFLNNVKKYIHLLPRFLRNFLFRIHRKIQKDCPDKKNEIIGNFFFLRFLCPIIIQPESYYLNSNNMIPITPRRTNNIFVTKILQKLAYKNEFQDWEVQLTKYNTLLVELQPIIEKIYKNLTNPSNNQDKLILTRSKRQIEIKDLYPVINKFLLDYFYIREFFNK